jgi:hypothetical protein
MSELRRVTINGRDAVVAYLDEDFNPVEPEQAKMMKITFSNGDSMWAEPKIFDAQE